MQAPQTMLALPTVPGMGKRLWERVPQAPALLR